MTHYMLSTCCSAKIIYDDICSECLDHCDEDFQYPDPEAQDIKRMAKNYPHTQVDRAEMMRINDSPPEATPGLPDTGG